MNYEQISGGVRLLKLGYKIAPEQFPPSEMLEQVITAEKAGFESIAASDHFHPWSEDGQSCFIWSWLGAAAARTKSIELGTGLTCPILRYNPAIIAQAAAVLAEVNGTPGGTRQYRDAGHRVPSS